MLLNPLLIGIGAASSRPLCNRESPSPDQFAFRIAPGRGYSPRGSTYIQTPKIRCPIALALTPQGWGSILITLVRGRVLKAFSEQPPSVQDRLELKRMRENKQLEKMVAGNEQGSWGYNGLPLARK